MLWDKVFNQLTRSAVNKTADVNGTDSAIQGLGLINPELDAETATSTETISPSCGEPAPKATQPIKRPTLFDFADSELIIGLVGTVGSDMSEIVGVLTDRLAIAGYTTHHIKISATIIPQIIPVNTAGLSEFERITRLMSAGTAARLKTGNNAILADGVAAEIATKRQIVDPCVRNAYIVNSLKHPAEVQRLRQIYPNGFYLIGIHPDETVRLEYLKRKNIQPEDVERLIERDKDERKTYGQKVNDTFHMSDFFVRIDNGDRLNLQNSLHRIIDILFGAPYATPTFDEYAMFMAFTASLRSADLSRQVGAVIAKNNEILSTGANDCPKYGGGLYWPAWDSDTHQIVDKADGRDYKVGLDSNKVEQARIIDDIVDHAKSYSIDESKLRTALISSRIKDLTEFGRVVHAEMESLLCCARNNISTRGATLYCTTFPCHNCAKHIIAAGLDRVVFVEPYQKSKAIEFHPDAISVGFRRSKDTVVFEPFVGVGPRRFFDLFSVRLGSGCEIVRKDSDGFVVPWSLTKTSKLRVQMLTVSYYDLECGAAGIFAKNKCEG